MTITNIRKLIPDDPHLREAIVSAIRFALLNKDAFKVFAGELPYEKLKNMEQ